MILFILKNMNTTCGKNIIIVFVIYDIVIHVAYRNTI